MDSGKHTLEEIVTYYFQDLPFDFVLKAVFLPVDQYQAAQVDVGSRPSGTSDPPHWKTPAAEASPTSCLVVQIHTNNIHLYKSPKKMLRAHPIPSPTVEFHISNICPYQTYFQIYAWHCSTSTRTNAKPCQTSIPLLAGGNTSIVVSESRSDHI